LPELLGELEQVRVVGMARLTSPVVMQAPVDRLLDVEEAAKQLGVSVDYIYKHHRELPLTRRRGHKLLFSSVGIDSHNRSTKIA
jgi:excisionase family DNA binding protein